MQISVKTLQNGFSIPVFGFGTWEIGGMMERDPDNDDAADVKAIQQAIDAGINHIDTAEKYADGHSEDIVGEAIKDFDRSKIFLASKVGQVHFRYEDLLQAAQDSLKRLQTDYLDLYYLHGPNPDVPIADTMKAMDKLMDEGLIRNIAVSNFTIERFEEAQATSNHKIVANQLHLNLIYREPERKGLVDYCQKNDVMLVAWRPVQKGILSGEHNEVLDYVCQRYGKTPSQIAINWLISQKNIITLSKMGSKEHLEENLGALNFTMDEADIALLDKEFPGQQDISNAVPLV